MARELDFKECNNACDDLQLDCDTTAEVPELTEIIGQPRAVKALKFGLKIRDKGFNIFVTGLPGSGRMTAVRDFIQRVAGEMPVPSDWCYVFNFDEPDRPNALRLPTGRGREFVKDMDRFVSNLTTSLDKAFSSEDYTNQRIEMLKGIDQKRKELANVIQSTAQRAGYMIQQTPNGPVLVEASTGAEAMTPQKLLETGFNLAKPSQEEKDEMRKQLAQLFLQMRDLEAEGQRMLEDLNRTVTTNAIAPGISAIEERYHSCEEVMAYLEAVNADILDNIPAILSYEQMTAQPQQMMPFKPEDPKDRYRVNLVVDNTDVEGAPVLMEMNPSHSKLFGVVEKEARFGALVTNFMNIRSGSIHKANGGFLVIPVERLFMDPFNWESLKQSILNESLEIEDPYERYGVMRTRSLRPEPIPFDGKVVIVGDPMSYAILYSRDREFRDLFKVKAEFEPTMERDMENIESYSSFICTLCNKEGLLHLDPSGLAAVIEYSSRLVAHKDKLSTRFSEVADIVREANYYAREEGASVIDRGHILRQMEEKVYRSSSIKERMQEMVEKGTVLIDTDGEAVGQVNGLAVLSMGDFMFGKPSRITASVAVGKGGVMDIEKQAEMGGPTHTKGVLILTGYLNRMYAQKGPLTLSARLVFEQSYSGVDGDSASSTELYALLSALSGAPIRQSLAVTGSVNQKGVVQAIGGVNQKVEGFFDLCNARGLTGDQGCLIPESNVQNLMLRDDVVSAVKDGRFHIYPVATIDEGISILTGVEAGSPDVDGAYPEGTIHSIVQGRLNEMVESMKSKKADDEDGNSK